MIALQLKTAIAAANIAAQGVRNADLLVRAETLKKAELERELDGAKIERSKLTDLEDEDAALRLVDGDASAPLKPARMRKLAKLNNRIPVLTNAIPLQGRRIAQAIQAQKAAHAPFAVAVTDIVRCVQNPAVRKIRALLGELETPLAELFAADAVRAQMIGERFPVCSDDPPFSGSIVARKFLAAVPARLRPDGLNDITIAKAAEAISAEITAQIQGDAK
jgi:hypothetical protein